MAELNPHHPSVQPVATAAALRQPAPKALVTRLFQAARLMPPRINAAARSIGERLDLLEQRDAGSPLSIDGRVTGCVPSQHNLDDEVVAGLMDTYATMKTEQGEATVAYQPGADWGASLADSWAVPSVAARNGDVATFRSFLENFFRNEALTGFWGGPEMFSIFAGTEGVGSLRRADLMQRQLDTWAKLTPEGSVADIEAPAAGNPWGYLVDEALVYEPSCEYHYHANFLRGLTKDSNHPIVVEVGGGFGGLAYQFLRHEGPATYIGFDLPENALLQAFYLQSTHPDANVLLGTNALTHLLNSEQVTSYDAVLLPNYLMPALESRVADVVANIRSLSEMPQETIDEYVSQMARLTGRYLFHENLSADRGDSLHGLSVENYPPFEGLDLLVRCESRWPRYERGSIYPCDEHLYVRRHGT